MKRSELLKTIMQITKAASPEVANAAMMAVISALKSEMSQRDIEKFAALIPEEFRDDWMATLGYPDDIFEKEEMMFDRGIRR